MDSYLVIENLPYAHLVRKRLLDHTLDNQAYNTINVYSLNIDKRQPLLFPGFVNAALFEWAGKDVSIGKSSILDCWKVSVRIIKTAYTRRNFN